MDDAIDGAVNDLYESEGVNERQEKMVRKFEDNAEPGLTPPSG